MTNEEALRRLEGMVTKYRNRASIQEFDLDIEALAQLRRAVEEDNGLAQQLLEVTRENERRLTIIENQAVVIRDKETIAAAYCRAKDERDELRRENESLQAKLDCKEADETAVRAAWVIANKSVDQQETIADLKKQLAELLTRAAPILACDEVSGCDCYKCLKKQLAGFKCMV